ncbi:unnamed protein product [Arabidopsis lyrata]|nr:unnamed protein product [Arabidopsis lyrata]
MSLCRPCLSFRPWFTRSAFGSLLSRSLPLQKLRFVCCCASFLKCAFVSSSWCCSLWMIAVLFFRRIRLSSVMRERFSFAPCPCVSDWFGSDRV